MQSHIQQKLGFLEYHHDFAEERKIKHRYLAEKQNPGLPFFQSTPPLSAPSSSSFSPIPTVSFPVSEIQIGLRLPLAGQAMPTECEYFIRYVYTTLFLPAAYNIAFL